MIVRTTVLFLIGVAIAIALAVLQYSQAPQGMLLYTPPAGVTAPNLTPSSQVGFFLGSLVLCVLSAFVAIVGYVAGAVFEKKSFGVAKSATVLAIGFGLLCFVSVAATKLWP